MCKTNLISSTFLTNMAQGSLICLLLVATICASTLGSKDANNTPDKDALTSLGDITTKLVTSLVEGQDEKVDIYGIANLLTSMSKAATIVDHPNLYQEMATNDVETQLMQITSAVRVLTEQQENLQETISLQEERLRVIDDLAFELNQSQAIVSQLEQQLEDKALGSDSAFVGFTAWGNVGSSYSSRDPIKFPEVLFEYGSGFDRYTGKYTCPVSGIYSVNVHLEERNSGGLIIDGMLDSTAVFRVHVHDDSTEHGTTATSAMMGCRAGQQIYMQSEDSGSSAEIQNIEKRSVFSVYLVKAMPANEVETGQLLL